MDEAVKKRFDSASKEYVTDRFVWRYRSACLVSKLAEPCSNDIILDIGCGPGKQIIDLCASIKQGIGIDISDGMLEEARKNARNQNVANVEFHIGTFDKPDKNCNLKEKHITKIISNYALHHLSLKEKQQAVGQMIATGGPSLQSIVIGDLMFFEDPENIQDEFETTGYVPGIDVPSTVEEMCGCFANTSFVVEAHKLHPLVGVLIAKKLP